MPEDARWMRWAPWVLGFLTLALYARTVAFPFIELDDGFYITHNPHLGRGLSLETLGWAMTSTYFGWWHPLTWVSHLLDVSFFGLWAGGHHLTSAVLHSFNAVLAFFVLRRFGVGAVYSLVIAALFAWHPMRVESVVWISERKDVLGVFFVLLSLLAYSRYRQQPTAARYALLVLFFAGALASKAMAVTLPVLLLVVDVWQTGNLHQWRARIVEKLPLFAMSLAAGLGIILTQKKVGALEKLEAVALSTRLETVPVSLLRYLGKTFWPNELSVFYPRTPLASWEWPLALAGVAVIAILLVVNRKRAPHLLAGAIWFLLVLMPVIGITQVGAQVIADRYTYLAHLGLFAGLVLSVPPALLAKWPRACFAITMVILMALCVRTSGQIDAWRDSETLLDQALSVEPDNAYIAKIIGARPVQRLLAEHRFEEALAAARALLEQSPRDPKLLALAGTAAAQAGRFEEAIGLLEASLRVDPGNEEIENFLRMAREDLAAQQRGTPRP